MGVPLPLSERACVCLRSEVEHLGGKARKGRNPITVSIYPRQQVKGISLFFPYERNTEQVRMPAPVASGGLG